MNFDAVASTASLDARPDAVLRRAANKLRALFVKQAEL